MDHEGRFIMAAEPDPEKQIEKNIRVQYSYGAVLVLYCIVGGDLRPLVIARYV